LRRHPPPFGRRMLAFLELMSQNGYAIDASSAGAFQASLDRISDPDIVVVSRFIIVTQ
jgi:hypothetical protein